MRDPNSRTRSSMKHMMRRIVVLGAFAGVLLGMGCLFDTRDAEAPDIGGGGCTLDTPEAAFGCMTGAISNQQDADYERSLSETFIFSPTLADSLDQNFVGTDVYTNWNKQREMDVLGLLFSDAQQTTVLFTPSLLINRNTFVRYKVPYTLEVITAIVPPDTTLYKGVAEIDVRLENGNWRVTFWNEVETVQGYSTWGFLRGILGLRLTP